MAHKKVIFRGFSFSRPQGEKILRFGAYLQGDFDDFIKRSVSLRGERLVLLKKKKNKGPCSLSPRCPFQNLLKTYEGIDLYFDKKEDLDR